jgi:hypothetical protein
VSRLSPRRVSCIRLASWIQLCRRHSE